MHDLTNLNHRMTNLGYDYSVIFWTNELIHQYESRYMDYNRYNIYNDLIIYFRGNKGHVVHFKPPVSLDGGIKISIYEDNYKYQVRVFENITELLKSMKDYIWWSFEPL